MRPLEPSPVVPFTLAIALENTTSSCSKASFCPMAPSCAANTMHSPHETACLKTPYMTAKQCSKSGISTKITFQYTGVLGLFNCQGGGWCPVTRRNKSASEFSHAVTCSASAKDIEWCNGKRPVCIKGVDVFAVYLFKEDKLKLIKCSDELEVSLEPFSFELLTVSPVAVFSKRLIQFAPIGLVNMLNSGGAIQSLEFDDHASLAKIGVKGCGEMRVFASEKPVNCKIDGVGVKFGYEDKMVRVQVPWPSSSRLSVVEFLF